MFDLMHIPDLLGRFKWSDIEIVLLRIWRNGIYTLWLISSPRDKDSGERSRALGPLVCSKRSIRNTIRVSNVFKTDQARHFARPELGQNGLLK